MTLDYLRAHARTFCKSDEAASAIEYAIVVAMVAVVVVAFVTPLGDKVQDIFNNILTTLGGDPVTRTTP
jgi:pilus assembly protein Flp/PilA